MVVTEILKLVSQNIAAEVSAGHFGQIGFMIFSGIKQVVGTGSSGDRPPQIC